MATAATRARIAASSGPAPSGGVPPARRSMRTSRRWAWRQRRSSRCCTTSWPPGGPCSVRAGSNPGTTAMRSARRRGASMASWPRIACSRSTGTTCARSAPIPTPSASGTTSCRGPGVRRSRSPSRWAWAAGRPTSGTRRDPGRRGRHGSSRRTKRAASATSSSCSTRAATRSTPRPSGPGRPSWNRPRRTPPTSRASPTSWAGTPTEPAWQRRWLGEAATADEAVLDRYGAVMLDICWALVRDRAPSPARPPTERRLDRDHGRRPGHRAAPRMVVVGAARPAHRGARLHGQLRPGGPHRGGGPDADPRGPRPVVGGRPGLVRVRGRRAARRRRVARRPRTCSRPSSAGR